MGSFIMDLHGLLPVYLNQLWFYCRWNYVGIQELPYDKIYLFIIE